MTKLSYTLGRMIFILVLGSTWWEPPDPWHESQKRQVNDSPPVRKSRPRLRRGGEVRTRKADAARLVSSQVQHTLEESQIWGCLQLMHKPYSVPGNYTMRGMALRFEVFEICRIGHVLTLGAKHSANCTCVAVDLLCSPRHES